MLSRPAVRRTPSSHTPRNETSEREGGSDRQPSAPSRNSVGESPQPIRFGRRHRTSDPKRTPLPSPHRILRTRCSTLPFALTRKRFGARPSTVLEIPATVPNAAGSIPAFVHPRTNIAHHELKGAAVGPILERVLENRSGRCAQLGRRHVLRYEIAKRPRVRALVCAIAPQGCDDGRKARAATDPDGGCLPPGAANGPADKYDDTNDWHRDPGERSEYREPVLDGDSAQGRRQGVHDQRR